jgi:hypothetical protein
MQRILILIAASLCTFAHSASDADRERRKREFLQRPVFVETIRKKEREAREKAGFNPTPRRVEVPKDLRQIPEMTVARRREIEARRPQSVGNAAVSMPAQNQGRKDGQCGFDKFIGNYCHYPEGKGWLMCTDRWGGCIHQEER